jgi:PAS fold
MTPPDEPAQTIPSSYGLAAVDPPVPMLILERDFRIRWISRTAIQELRLQPDMLIGRSWYDLFPESRSRRALHEALCRGERDAIDLPCIPLSLGCGTQYFSLRLRPLRASASRQLPLSSSADFATASRCMIETFMSPVAIGNSFRLMINDARFKH